MNQIIQLPTPKVAYADKPLCLNPSLSLLDAEMQRDNVGYVEPWSLQQLQSLNQSKAEFS